MDLVIGGKYQNKKIFAGNKYGIPVEKMVSCLEDFDKVINAECVYDLDEMIRKYVKCGKDYKKAVDEIINSKKCRVIISNEIGCGIVPMDKFQREYREAAGRMLCTLASKSENVYRVVCGIGNKIK